MILRVGQYGIISIANTNTSSKRDAIVISQNTSITGPISQTDTRIDYGYNEHIKFSTEEEAIEMFAIIHNIMIYGIEAEKQLNHACDAYAVMSKVLLKKG